MPVLPARSRRLPCRAAHALGVVAFALALPLGVARAQRPDSAAATAAAADTSLPVARAATARRAPSVDGRDDDPVWRAAPLIEAFRQREPSENAAPTFRTVAKVAVDAGALYVFVRAYDPHPDSLIALLSRRDAQTPSDYVRVSIDSYHDRRTAYTFTLTPTNVQRDVYVFADGDQSDPSWDAVWQSGARVDAEGWTATFRIPLSQLRFPAPVPGQPLVFGFAIERRIARLNERDTWPLIRRSAAGLVSQYGTLTGLDVVREPRRVEVRPYYVEKNVMEPRTLAAADGATRAAQTHPERRTVGLDLKYGVSSKFTLDATVNPDFGQVEADPAVLNLGAFETFYPERRPFFVEGTNIFTFNLGDCGGGACSGLFYPRRIGRSPELAGVFGDAATPQFTGVLGAAKLTGRTERGFSVGVLAAATNRVAGADSGTAEPAAQYLVARAQQDRRGGNSTFGAMLTGMRRSLDPWSAPYLRRDALALGLDGRHRFGPGNDFELSGYATASRVGGSARAIALTEASSVHNYERPGSGLPLDTTRTSLAGTAAQFTLAKRGGGITRFSVSGWRRSPGFDVNDVGYLDRSDQEGARVWGQLNALQPRAFYRRGSLNVNAWHTWTTGGLPTDVGADVGGDAELTNFWSVYAGGGPRGIGGAAYDDRAARGGPAVRRAPGWSAWAGARGDNRRSVAPSLNASVNRGDGGRSASWNVNPGVDLRVAERLQGNVGVAFGVNHNDWQWVNNYNVGTDSAAYTFGHLDQHTASLTARLDYTFTPWVSLQVYAQPFLTSGGYADWRALADPDAADYAARWRPFADGTQSTPTGFNYKQYRSNVVLRWEYRPGSTLFAVWQQGRTQSDRDLGSFQAMRDARNLFRTWPNNTLLLKLSYWFNP